MLSTIVLRTSLDLIDCVVALVILASAALSFDFFMFCDSNRAVVLGVAAYMVYSIALAVELWVDGGSSSSARHLMCTYSDKY